MHPSETRTREENRSRALEKSEVDLDSPDQRSGSIDLTCRTHPKPFEIHETGLLLLCLPQWETGGVVICPDDRHDDHSPVDNSQRLLTISLPYWNEP
jgi:hypothetical protein